MTKFPFLFWTTKNPDITRVCGSTPLVVRNLRLLVETPEPYLREYTNRNNNANIVINFIATPQGNDMDIVTNFTERVNEVLFYCSLFSRK